MSEKIPASGIADARVTTALAAFPNVSPEDEQYLIEWYRKKASAYDVGMLASDPAIKPGLDAFRARHVDRFTAADIVRALIFVAVVAGVSVLVFALRG